MNRIERIREQAEWVATLNANDMDGISAANINAELLEVLAALREAKAENERLNVIADAAEALIERTITDMMEVARREVRLSTLLRQRRNRLAVSPPADEAKCGAGRGSDTTGAGARNTRPTTPADEAKR